MWFFLVVTLADVVMGGGKTLLSVLLGSTVPVSWSWALQPDYTVAPRGAPTTLVSGLSSRVQELFQVKRWRRRRRVSEEERIVEGHPIDIQESPSYTSITIMQNSGQSGLCGGNLLTERHVLTAAHCVVDPVSGAELFRLMSPSSLKVRVGSTYKDEGGREHEVRKICVHPQYLQREPVNSYKDIAVLTLNHAVHLDAMAQTAPLYPPLTVEETKRLSGNNCTVAGWGLTSQDGEESDHLRQIEVTLQDMKTCEKFYMTEFDPMVQLCALDQGKDSCQGDSGGGLFCHGSIIAVTSWGWGCAAGSPGVYARVDNAHEFIEHAIHGASLVPLTASLVPLTLAVSFTVSLL